MQKVKAHGILLSLPQDAFDSSFPGSAIARVLGLRLWIGTGNGGLDSNRVEAGESWTVRIVNAGISHPSPTSYSMYFTHMHSLFECSARLCCNRCNNIVTVFLL